MFFLTLTLSHASPIFPTGIKPSGVDLFGGFTSEYCSIQNEEPESNFAENSDEEMTDTVSQDDFNYKEREISISETDEVRIKLASDTPEINIFKNAVPEDIMSALAEVSEKTATEVGTELTAKLGAELVSDSNPITGIVMNLVMCGVGIFQGSQADNEDEARIIFDNCTGSIGMIDQVFQLVELAYKKIYRIIHTKRDFI